MTPYQPDDLPLDNLDYKRLLPLVGQANAQLARYDGLLQGIPNPMVMLSPLTTQEAVLSSKIEGTQATVDEVLEQEAGLTREGEKYKDIQEISNYRTALMKACDHVEIYPIRLGLIREVHKILLGSVRGQHQTPGHFRKDQNWIGRQGCSMEQATFVPPSPCALAQHLQAWETYLEIDDIDHLVQVAIVHAQFELLHPFKDGNGRIGRMLIPLFLYQKKAMTCPMFYISEYLEANRDAYYEHLKAISAQGDWNGWIAFFLEAVALQARTNSERVSAIMKLYERMKHRLQDMTGSRYAIYLLDALFGRPLFQTTDLVTELERRCGLHRKTTLTLLRPLKQAGILVEIKPAAGNRAAVLCFEELVALAEGRQITPSVRSV